MAQDFHQQWWARTLEITHGPFMGRQGVVQMTDSPRVQVAFPGRNKAGEIERLWFLVDDVRLVEAEA